MPKVCHFIEPNPDDELRQKAKESDGEYPRILEFATGEFGEVYTTAPVRAGILLGVLGLDLDEYVLIGNRPEPNVAGGPPTDEYRYTEFETVNADRDESYRVVRHTDWIRDKVDEVVDALTSLNTEG
ncbi:MAG: hypothetical protein ABEN55_00510 [Bradymonadaceae bacterium]